MIKVKKYSIKIILQKNTSNKTDLPDSQSGKEKVEPKNDPTDFSSSSDSVGKKFRRFGANGAKSQPANKIVFNIVSLTWDFG